jgi:hypothetical protein
MEKSIQGYLGSLQLGEVQQFKNLDMVPIVSDYHDGLGTTIPEIVSAKLRRL